MKILIYISGLLGFTFLLLRFIGIPMQFELNSVFMILAAVLLLLVFLPLVIIDKIRYDRKINEIIKSHKKNNSGELKTQKGESKTKGWNMNNSPFRERRSGLTWGGGNIKGANASRGSRRSFRK